MIKGLSFIQISAIGVSANVLMMSMNLSNITIPNFHNVDYPFTINGISRRGAMGLLDNVNSNEKSETL